MQHWLFRYGLAVVLFAAVLGLSIMLRELGVRLNLTIPVILALVATAWYGGLVPGILIGVLFQATTIYFTPVAPDSTVARTAFMHFSVFSLYVFLAFVISGVRRIQHRLREQRDMLHVTLSSIGDAVVTTDTTGRINFMNGVAERMTGWQLSEAEGRSLDDVFQIMNEQTRETVPTPVDKVIETGGVVGMANHTVLRSKDGREIPIDDSAAPIRDGDEVKGVVLVFSDVTERKAAERARRESEIMRRIVAAQEGERLRIARDLHDQLGQQMTALRLKVESFAERCREYAGLSPEIDELQQAANTIDRDIGYLSWELRPTELEELGLENALSTFVREWSRQYSIAAEFMMSRAEGERPASEIRRLDQHVETNLYRIVQEALNNVVKHSGAQNVSVLLQHAEQHTTLIIEDDGAGFEGGDIHTTEGGTFHPPSIPAPSDLARPDAADAPIPMPAGLGLIGMHERASLLKGSLQIDSRPGAGTTILARIPVH